MKSKNTKNTIGAKFDKIRKNRGMRLNVFADKLGYKSKQAVFYWLQADDDSWKLSEIIRWCEVLDVPREKIVKL